MPQIDTELLKTHTLQTCPDCGNRMLVPNNTRLLPWHTRYGAGYKRVPGEQPKPCIGAGRLV